MFSLTAYDRQKKQEVPVDASSQNAPGSVDDSLVHARAVEAAIWGMPAV
jgi:hypothetical protein